MNDGNVSRMLLLRNNHKSTMNEDVFPIEHFQQSWKLKTTILEIKLILQQPGFHDAFTGHWLIFTYMDG